VGFPRLYAIVDEEVARSAGWTVPDLSKAFLRGGAKLLQIRAKTARSAALLKMCDAVVAEARSCGARIIVNDRADIARLASAAGVHLGQEDLPVAAARALLGPAAVVGLSTHDVPQVDAADIDAITYLAVGPVFETPNKAMGSRAVGLDLVRYAAQAVRRWAETGATRSRLPVVAIGGITLERAPAVVATGAAAVAVISDLLKGGDPEGRVRSYIDLLGE
jgi:thiamine-phosphate pyrophosphorylase